MLSVDAGRTPTGKRAFSLEYKIEFLREWDACIERGAKTRLLRQNRLEFGTVRRWIYARDRGDLDASMLATARKGRGALDAKDRAELVRLRAENSRLRERVDQAETAQEILGNAFELLKGINSSSSGQETAPVPPALMSVSEYQDYLRGHRLG